MKTYRYGYKENLIGSSWYYIEKKILFCWFEYLTFDNKTDMLECVKQLKEHGNIIIRVN